MLFCLLAVSLRGAIHFDSAVPVPSVAALQRASATLADFSPGTDASATSNSGSDAPPKPLVDEAKVFVFDDCIFEGAVFDASSTVESEGSWINLRVHNVLLEHACGFYSLLEAAKCLPASYDLMLPDDAFSLRKEIVNFIATKLDTNIESGEGSGTWREEIASLYFPENQNLTSPRPDLLIIVAHGAKERVYLDSINDYLEAMACPGTHIDAFALLAFAQMWDVRVVVFRQEGVGWTSDKRQFMPEKYVHEEKSIYLVHTDQWVSWAHADEQDCGVKSCRVTSKRISAHHKFLNFRSNVESILPSATDLTALPSAAPSNGKQPDPIQPCETLPILHEAMQAGREAVMLTGNVGAKANVLSEACRQLDFAQVHLRNMFDDMQTSQQAGKSKKHVVLAVKQKNIASLRTAYKRARFEFDKLINMARGIQSIYKITSVPASSSADVTEHAIRTLVALDSSLCLTSEQLEEWYDKLRNRGRMLSTMYRENDYLLMVDETIDLLKHYSGRQILDDKDFDALLEDLKTYGWVLSPRMWTREEIAVMCVILLDPNLRFNNILQKNDKKDEDRQNRGMACLDPRVQAIMYSRLKQYKFVREDEHLPMDVPAAVVLNSGGSYLQRATWHYAVDCRFVVDDKVDAMLFEVTKTPEYTHCDGLYLATTTRRPNGQPVYVGISPTQFFGASGKNKLSWDSQPMKNALSPGHELFEYFIEKDCVGKTFNAERVLYWENGKAVFQSVTAYGTDMKLLTMDCESLLHSITKWSRISSFDFKNKKSVMASGSKKNIPELSRVEVKGTIAPNYTFACGTKRIEVDIKRTVLHSRPTPLKKQRFHKDGPTLFDDKQFDDHGNILPWAPGTSKRTVPLPPGISVSALFAFFCRTFLGLKPVERKEHERSCSSGSLRLHARIGRAIIFAFDTDHQVWNMNNV